MTAPGDFRDKVSEEIDRHGFVERKTATVTSISRQDAGGF